MQELSLTVLWKKTKEPNIVNIKKEPSTAAFPINPLGHVTASVCKSSNYLLIIRGYRVHSGQLQNANIFKQRNNVQRNFRTVNSSTTCRWSSHQTCLSCNFSGALHTNAQMTPEPNNLMMMLLSNQDVFINGYGNLTSGNGAILGAWSANQVAAGM